MPSPPESGRGRASPPLAQRWLRAFGRFWWDFLVGDTPELFVGAVAVIGLLALLVRAGVSRWAGAVLFPLLVAVLLALTVGRAYRRKG